MSLVTKKKPHTHNFYCANLRPYAIFVFTDCIKKEKNITDSSQLWHHVPFCLYLLCTVCTNDFFMSKNIIKCWTGAQILIVVTCFAFVFWTVINFYFFNNFFCCFSVFAKWPLRIRSTLHYISSFSTLLCSVAPLGYNSQIIAKKSTGNLGIEKY